MPRKQQDLPKEVVQSYLVTSARYNFSVFEKRILYRIVELIQKEIQGLSFSSDVKIQPSLFDDREITMPLSMFLLRNEADNNHKNIRQAFKDLASRVVEKENNRKYVVFHVIARAEVDKYSRSVKFVIDRELYADLLDFAKGYSTYELQVAFSFRSQYTMRLYELTSRQKKPIVYSIARLREIFCLEDHYQATSAFIKRVIAPAQRELEASTAPCFFTYKLMKTSRSITHICFTNQQPDRQKPACIARVKECGRRSKTE